MTIDLANTDLLLTTTRSVRRRLDLTRPVPLRLVDECLAIALQAPTEARPPGWSFVVVTDEAKRHAIAAHYKAAWEQYLADHTPIYGPDDTSGEVGSEVIESVQYLADHLHQVPVFVIPCISPRLEPGNLFATATLYGSIMPAASSFMLTARARGLGTLLTTLSLMREPDIADILDIPDDVTQCGLIPVAYYTGDRFQPAKRRPCREIVSYDSWSNHQLEHLAS